MIFVNFKTYHETSGKKAIHLATIAEKLSNETRVPIISVIQPLDAALVKKEVTTPVWLQHVDAVESGAHTGFININTALSWGISGTLLNHSEHPLSFEQIEQTVTAIRNIKAPSSTDLYNFSIMICAPNLDELIRFAKLQPDFLAYEPPELIGSKTTSVATAYPEIIKNAVRVAGKIPLIVGAGVKTAEDVRLSLHYGAKGILVASGVDLTADPKKVLTEFAKEFQNN